MSTPHQLLTAVVLRVDYGCVCAAWTQTSDAERASLGIAPPSVLLHSQMVSAVAALTRDEQLRVNAASSAEFARLYEGPANRPAMLRRAAELSAPTMPGGATLADPFEQAVEANVQWRITCSAWHNSTEAERVALGLKAPTDDGYAPVRRAAEKLNRADRDRVSTEAYYCFTDRFANNRLAILEAATKRLAPKAAPVAALKPVQFAQAVPAAAPKPSIDPWKSTVEKLTAEAQFTFPSINSEATNTRLHSNWKP